MMNKVIVITGASKGIGFSLVKKALLSGYKVAATSRDPKKLLDALKKENFNNELLDKLLVVKMEFTTESINSAIKTIIHHFKRIDVLINNAGYATIGSIEEIPMDEVYENFDVNVFKLLEITKLALPYLKQQEKANIINLASISGNVTGPAQGIYSASKASVIMLSEALASELIDDNIYVTAVCPSGVNTQFLDSESLHTTNSNNLIVSKEIAALHQFNHHQSGNPDLVANAILKILTMSNPPRRIYLGKPAITALKNKLNEINHLINEYLEISYSIDD